MENFVLHSKYKPTGDQPEAIEKLVEGINRGDREQVLLGVTGSGKTFTMANVIERVNRPTLVLAHNKTLAAQLCSEFSPKMPLNILFPIMIIISLKHICRALILILKRTLLLMMKLISYVTVPPAHYPKGVML